MIKDMFGWRIIMCDGVVLEILDIKARGSAYKG